MRIRMLSGYKHLPATDSQLQAYCGEAHSPKWTAMRFSFGAGRHADDRKPRHFETHQEDELRDFLSEDATKYPVVKVWVQGKVQPKKAHLVPFGNSVAVALEDGFHVIVEELAAV